MNTLLIISLIIFLGYVLTMIKMFGVPSSLSDTYYLLDGKKKGTGAFFILFMFIICFLLMIPMIEITPENWKFVAFLAILGLGFVGAAPMFLESSTSKVHYTAAGMATAGGLTWIFVVAPQYWWCLLLTTVAVIMIAMKTKTWKCYTFWLEMIVFISVYIAALLFASL